MRREKRRCAAGGRDRGFPFVCGEALRRRHCGEPLGRFENARKIFGALYIACEPVHVVGGAGEHRYGLATCSPPAAWRRGGVGGGLWRSERISPHPQPFPTTRFAR